MKLELSPQITTNRLLLQRLQYDDAEQIFNNYASRPEATKYMAWPTHRSLDDTRSFLDYAIGGWDNGTDYTYAIRKGPGEPVMGSWGVMDFGGKLQFGYILAPEHWGNGYLTEVCRVMMGILRTKPGIYRIGTFVDADNVASARVLEKAGLVEEARLKRWHRFPNQGNDPKDCILYNLVF